MLAHVVGWPTVALAVVLTVRRAVKNPGEWWRLIGGIGVLLAMLAATVIISLVVPGTQVPGFHLPDLTRTAAPAATPVWPPGGPRAFPGWTRGGPDGTGDRRHALPATGYPGSAAGLSGSPRYPGPSACQTSQRTAAGGQTPSGTAITERD